MPKSNKDQSRSFGPLGACLKKNSTARLELLQTEESFLQILNAIGDMVLVKGPQSKLIWANQAFCDHYGMTPKQLRGILDAPFSEPDHTQQYVKDDTWVFENKKILRIPQEPVKRHDGVIRIFNTVKSPIFDHEGRVIMTVGISRDITDQLEAQKIAEEQRARATYSSKMATLGEMAGGIAHEINTPLGAISLLAEMIANQNESLAPPDPEIAKNAASISSVTERIARVIQGLKDFSRDATNDPKTLFTYRSLIESTMELCHVKLKANNVNVEIVQENLDIQGQGQVIQLSQCLLNLIHNACDSITELSEKWIEIKTLVTDKHFGIHVTDSGLGIKPEIVEKMFQPFFTTKGVGQGTGLGLSISASIIKSHGGNLIYDSSNPHTSFVIQLPVLKGHL